MASSRTDRGAFTLIEVLVVVAIIALLIAILMPSLRNARAQARRTVCLTSLHQFYLGSMGYANAYRDRLPDTRTLGKHGYRRAAGLTDPSLPFSLPEIFGLQGALERAKCLPQRSNLWVCPAAADSWMAEYRNTYAFNVVSNVIDQQLTVILKANPRGLNNFNTIWVWDNFLLLPGDCGIMGPFSNKTIPTKNRVFPHDYAYGKSSTFSQRKAINALFLDGHAAQQPQ